MLTIAMSMLMILVLKIMMLCSVTLIIKTAVLILSVNGELEIGTIQMELQWQIWVTMFIWVIAATFSEVEAHKPCFSDARVIHLRQGNFVVKYRMLTI